MDRSPRLCVAVVINMAPHPTGAGGGGGYVTALCRVPELHVSGCGTSQRTDHGALLPAMPPAVSTRKNDAQKRGSPRSGTASPPADRRGFTAAPPITGQCVTSYCHIQKGAQVADCKSPTTMPSGSTNMAKCPTLGIGVFVTSTLAPSSAAFFSVISMFSTLK